MYINVGVGVGVWFLLSVHLSVRLCVYVRIYIYILQSAASNSQKWHNKKQTTCSRTRMFTSECTHEYVRTQIYMHTRKHTHIADSYLVYTSTHSHKYTHSHTHTHTHTHTQTFTHTRTHASARAHTHACGHTHTRTHTHTHTSRMLSTIQEAKQPKASHMSLLQFPRLWGQIHRVHDQRRAWLLRAGAVSPIVFTRIYYVCVRCVLYVVYACDMYYIQIKYVHHMFVGPEV